MAGLIVVDNASHDGAADLLRADGVEVVQTSENLGYARGMRYGVDFLRRRCHVDAILLLTHETELAPDALGLLVQQLATPGTAVVGPLLTLRGDPDRVYTCGGAVDNGSGLPVHRLARTSVVSVTSSPFVTTWLDGAALLVDIAAWDRTGGLDGTFFLYLEDAEFGVRCRNLGYRVVCVPEARASVAYADSVSQYVAVRSGVRFLLRTGHRARAVTLAGRVVGGAVREVLQGGGPVAATARVVGAVHAFTGNFSPRWLGPRRRAFATSSKTYPQRSAP